MPHALPQVVVPDALRALQALGRAWRAEFTMPIVAVGGSNGKTTAKEMTAAILSRMGLVMATHGNLNNHIGVPVTLMRLEPSHRSAVIEMGANRIGDVAELMRLARPTVGLITNAGAEHLEGFGNLDGVAQGEGEMVSCLEPDATAIINADDVYAGYWRGVAAARRIVTFGVHADADFAAKNAVQAIERGEFVTRCATIFLLFLLITLIFFWPAFAHLDRALVGPPEDNIQDFWDTWYAFVAHDHAEISSGPRFCAFRKEHLSFIILSHGRSSRLVFC